MAGNGPLRRRGDGGDAGRLPRRRRGGPALSEPPPVPGVRHRTVRVRGVELHLAEAGEGGDVVLCLHGWPQHWYMWRHLMPALAGRHRVIALDQRGFGWSQAPPDGYRKEELVDDVLALLDELGIKRVKLVGHDWGGWVGFLLCLRDPERVARFLALAIAAPWISRRAVAPHLWRFWYQWLLLAPGAGYRLHRSGSFVARVLVGGSVRREVWDPATIDAFAAAFREPARARAAVQMYRVFNLREVPAIAAGRYAGARLTVPARLLLGAGDPVIRPEMLAGWRRHAPAMEVEVVERCGHFIADEAPELVADRALKLFG